MRREPIPSSIAILGAGPCGLACARELARLGYEGWTVWEREQVAGGHAGSEIDGAGFTWDQGGHVVFSHFGEFDRLLEEVLGDDVYEHERSSYVLVGDRWVPYPFQNNLRYLDPEDAYECLVGLIEAPGGDRKDDFATWIERTFGPGIAARFMRPYNSKVWTTELERMSARWVGERVSVVDTHRALRNLVLGLDDVAWGPNNTFRFPTTGGTGEIYRRLALQLGDRLRFGREVVGVDVGRRCVSFTDGSTEEYDALVSTIPLDLLVASIEECPSDVRAAAELLEHNCVRVVGVGCERPLMDERSWLYFADPAVPFYRVTNFAKYAAANVPGADTTRYSSYLTETAYRPGRHDHVDGLDDSVVDALVSTGLIDWDTPIASQHTIDIEYAYPIPTLDRDPAVERIQEWLMEHRIYSRGRFGTWRYEIGNMDHAVKMGVDVARLLVEDRPEALWAS